MSFVNSPFPAPGSSAESAPDRQKSPVLAGPSMLGPDFLSRPLSVEISIRRDLLSQVEGSICHSRSEWWKLWM